MIEFNVPLPNFNIYLVGGYVRDHLLGVQSKDIDIVCEAESFEEMLEWVEKTHKKIFLSKPEFFTIRAIANGSGIVHDYVLARKESQYSDSRRPDSVSVGTINEDLSRRDFTIGAMAYNIKTGEFLDPFNGRQDLEDKIIRCVGDTRDRLDEDTLRIIRAIRFSITKGFKLHPSIELVLQMREWADKLQNISTDRIRQELDKCFKHSTIDTLKLLAEIHPRFIEVIFNDKLWLKITSEKK